MRRNCYGTAFQGPQPYVHPQASVTDTVKRGSLPYTCDAASAAPVPPTCSLRGTDRGCEHALASAPSDPLVPSSTPYARALRVLAAARLGWRTRDGIPRLTRGELVSRTASYTYSLVHVKVRVRTCTYTCTYTYLYTYKAYSCPATPYSRLSASIIQHALQRCMGSSLN